MGVRTAMGNSTRPHPDPRRNRSLGKNLPQPSRQSANRIDGPLFDWDGLPMVGKLDRGGGCPLSYRTGIGIRQSRADGAQLKALQKALQQSETNGDKPVQTSTPIYRETLEITRNEEKFPEACKSQGG